MPDVKELQDQIAALQERNKTLESAYLKSEARHVAQEVSSDADLTMPLIADLGEVSHLGKGRVAVVARSTGTSLLDHARSEAVQSRLGQFAKTETKNKDETDDTPDTRPERPGDWSDMTPSQKRDFVKRATEYRLKQQGRM